MSDNQEDPVEVLALEYLRATEAGEQPDLERLLHQLDTEEQRKDLRDLCEAAGYAQRHFPEQLRPQTLVAGRYRLKEHIGSGGFGKVWRAYDEKLERDVALKLFHALRDDKAIQDDLQREKRALSGLRHDGIVSLLDFGKHEDAHFLAMDFIEGKSLEKALLAFSQKDQPYPPTREAVEREFGKALAAETSLVEENWHRTAAKLTCGILWALAVAHAHKPHKVVHRDLKPGNVLLRRGGRPVLVDFGLAGIGDTEGDITGRLFGTVAYLAPEQIQSGKTGKDELTDVYQAGLLLYELLTLQRAFPGADRSRLLQSVQRGEFAPPRRVRSEIPQLLEDICLRALELDPTRRYQSAEAFRDDLERWLEGSLPNASRLGAAGRMLRTGRLALWRHRAAAALLVAVAAGAMAMQAMQPPLLVSDMRLVDAKTLEVNVNRPAIVMVMLRERLPDGSNGAMLLANSEGKSRTEPRQVIEGKNTLTFDAEIEQADLDGGKLKIVPREVETAKAYAAFSSRVMLEQERLGRGLTAKEFEQIQIELKSSTRGGNTPVDIDLTGILD